MFSSYFTLAILAIQHTSECLDKMVFKELLQVGAEGSLVGLDKPFSFKMVHNEDRTLIEHLK